MTRQSSSIYLRTTFFDGRSLFASPPGVTNLSDCREETGVN